MFAFPPLFYANTSFYRQEEKAKMEGGEGRKTGGPVGTDEEREEGGEGGRRRWSRL